MEPTNIPPSVAPTLPADVELGEASLVKKEQQQSVESDDEKLASTGSGKDEESSTGSDPPTTIDKDEAENANRPTGMKFVLLFTCVLMGCLVVGYQESCIATLTPVITDDFNALNQLGWYAIANLLATSATMLVYGQLYSFFSMKKIYIASFFIFTIASIVSAAAPSSIVFIVGRALSGLGSAGIFAGLTIIIANTTSLRHRATYTGVLGSVECLALSFGPLISGTIARYSTWRIAFWIIVPVGAIIMIVVFFSIDDLRRPENADLSRKEKCKRIDFIGIPLNIVMTLCLVLGLQWAGTAYAWSNWRIILLLVLAGVFFLIFLFAEWRAGDNAMIPLKMLSRRTVALANINQFCNVGGLSVIAYYIAIYFQAVRGATTFGSGLMYLPTAASMTVAALVGGPITSFIGYPNVLLIVGSILMTIGAGLITLFTPNTPTPHWIGFQILYGVGAGLAFQPSWVAVQTVLPDSLVPTALVTIGFSQMFGGIIVLSIAQNIFFNKLSQYLSATVPGFDTRAILRSGALNIINSIPDQHREQALKAYSKALVDVFYIALALSVITAVCAFGMEWKSVKKEKTEKTEKKEMA